MMIISRLFNQKKALLSFWGTGQLPETILVSILSMVFIQDSKLVFIFRDISPISSNQILRRPYYLSVSVAQSWFRVCFWKLQFNDVRSLQKHLQAFNFTLLSGDKVAVIFFLFWLYTYKLGLVYHMPINRFEVQIILF